MHAYEKLVESTGISTSRVFKLKAGESVVLDKGNIVRGETLPYDIDGRKATSYTCVVLKGEDTATIFAKAGKVLVEAQKELQLENVSF